ncbi:MAG: hypothetical protein IJ852_01805 [Alphaproteobacteria bacterium]|nr:hypothetical protein [Alphaproteobacteria bacterium]
MVRKKINKYSFSDSLEMLNKLQQMAIDEGNINLALKAEELKFKVASMQADSENELSNANLTKILVDFINDKQSSENTGGVCTSHTNQEEI